MPRRHANFDEQAKATALRCLPESKRDKALQREEASRLTFTARANADTARTAGRKGTRHRDYLLSFLAYPTGGRISEILGLRWSNIYQTDAATLCRFEFAKGGKHREIKIADDLAAALLAVKAEKKAADDDFVFVSQKGGPLSYSQAWRIVSGLASDARLSSDTRRVLPHTLRHSVATQLLEA